MSTLSVTVEKLTIHPHPNADALELAQVGLYRAVVPKGVYQTGDYALYIPEQAVLPDELIDELGLTGRLGGKQKNRVTTVRLRGEISQGIVCRPKQLPIAWDALRTEIEAGITHDWHGTSDDQDYADQLGITKWSAPIPVHLDGLVEHVPGLLRWIEIENLQRFPDIFLPGEPVVVTEKIHGSACLITCLRDEDDCRLYVSSKGHGSRSRALIPDSANLYCRALTAGESALAVAAGALSGWLKAKRLGIFGEVYGKGVQDLHYGANASTGDDIGYAMFDIAVDYGDGIICWLDTAEIDQLCLRLALRVKRVPELYRGLFDLEKIKKLVDGMESVSGQQLHLREGVVIRPQTERYSDILGGRAIAKYVSADYLTRRGGTEFE